ncbi:MAG: RagB/SusD family nutrient uptake outer membrane protein [Alistipes sp.]|nr:RagB/SusD family nutrient uptake outer membrane protein [Alistipes sp.]
MKKLYAYVLMFAATGFGVTSCSDFLQPESPSAFTPELVYENYDFTYKGLMGVYSKFNEDATYSQYLGIILNCQSDTEIRSFTVTKPASDDGRGTTNYMEATDGSGAMVTKAVEALYVAIERANLLIEGIEGSAAYKSGETDFVQMHGEAIALRAQCYRDLVRMLGNVPFKMEATKTDLSNVYLPKTDRFEIMETLIAQLQKYESELPWKQETPERITRGYAHGLCAQLALMRAGWNFTPEGEWVEPADDAREYYKIAMDQTKTVMDEGGYSLTQASADYSGYETFWRTINQRQYVDNEVLYQIGFILSRSSEFGYTIGPRIRTTTTKYGYGTQGQIFVPIEFYYSYHPEDTRRPVSVCFSDFRDMSSTSDYANAVESTTGISEYLISNPQEFRVGKWNTMWMPSDFAAASYAANTKTGTGVAFPMMRYSDILLMYAEAAYNYNGSATADAKAALKAVRQRAIPTMSDADFEAYLAGKAADRRGDKFMKAIKDERRWEFVGEGIRKWDLIRWGELAEAIADMKTACAEIIPENGEPSYKFEFPTRKVNGETVTRAIPKVVYYKYDANNEMIVDLNLDYELSKAPSAEYYSSLASGGTTSWFYSQDEDTGEVKLNSGITKPKSSFKEYLEDIARGLADPKYGAVNCPFYPIPANMIRDYNGVLQQDYGFPN